MRLGKKNCTFGFEAPVSASTAAIEKRVGGKLAMLAAVNIKSTVIVVQ